MRPNYFKYIDSRLEHLVGASYHGGVAAGVDATGAAAILGTLSYGLISGEYDPLFVGLGVGIASSLVHFYQNHKSEKHKDQFLEAWRTRTELRKKYPDKFKTPYSGLEEEI